jgi:hypothetical protein
VDLGVEFENCSDGSLFRGNWVNDCGRGLSYINYPLCARYAEQRGRDVNGEVSYNVLYHCNETISLQAVSAVNLWNNVIYDGIGTTPYGLYISDGDALSTLYAERIDCRNNIIGGGMSKSVFLTHAYSRIFSVFDYNAVQSALFFEFDTSTHLTLAQVQAAGKAMHCFTASPRFVDAPNHVFRELPDSPCVGAGVDVGLTQDHVGNVIVGFPDIGAYEYQEESVATKKTVLFTLAVTASPDFFPAILPTSLSVAKGVVAIYSVSFTAQGGFTGPVTLAVLNLPTGAVATFDKTSINVTETAILSITTVSVALGTFSLSVEGTANL